VVVKMVLFLFMFCLATLTIDAGNVVHEVSPTLFGVFFEEINHAGTGGLYGELGMTP